MRQGRRRGGRAGEAGFTLVEVLVAVTCMALLAAVAVPRLQGYALEARLGAARPYLLEAAARQRMHRIEHGRYCCNGVDGAQEGPMAAALNLSVGETGDFCLVFVCRSAALCERASASPDFIVPGGSSAPDFEVWALLRDTAGPTGVAGPAGSGVTCAPSPGKPAPSGWVRPRTAAGQAGRGGQVVALRYPPPPNGLAAVPGTYRPIRLDWRDGVALTDALLP